MRYEYMTLTRAAGANTVEQLNALGSLRWRLVSVDDGIVFYFIREIPEVGVNVGQQYSERWDTPEQSGGFSITKDDKP